jgi:hypothetical protein
VDLHRDAVLLRQRDVRLEALELRRTARPSVRKKSSPVSDRPHARLRGELVDHGDRLAEHALLGIRGCFVGMDRHRREDARVGCRGPRRPPARLDVAARLRRR